MEKFIYGVILGSGGMALWNWMQAENISAAWYTWPLMALALALCTLTIHHFLASHAELEPKAAWVGLAIIGVPAVLVSSLVVSFFI
ncbi:MAG: dehalogenase [Rhodospirillaceae bacterium]|jgi:phosphate/sulfate permease|nr:dehalogenase [Rhodospirillaceae bacterium]|tara:strand:+ start:1000 stop:1257 length:258 start_codon:yes stop_codon:yes gene_type:complete